MKTEVEIQEYKEKLEAQMTRHNAPKEDFFHLVDPETADALGMISLHSLKLDHVYMGDFRDESGEHMYMRLLDLPAGRLYKRI